MVNIRYSYCLYFSLLGLMACDMMPTILGEMDQIEEKCAVVDDPEIYRNLKVDPDIEEIVDYSLILELKRNGYLSACGIHVFKKDARFIVAKGRDDIPIARQAYIAIKKGQSSFRFYLLCDVGGLASYGRDMNGSPRKMVIARDGANDSCSITVDRSVAPVLLGARDQNGRLEVEYE